MPTKRDDVLLEAILDVKGEVGELRGEVRQCLLLEGRVRILEDRASNEKGASSAKKTIWHNAWEAGKIPLAAFIGGVIGKFIK